jgi:hypothetical protein
MIIRNLVGLYSITIRQVLFSVTNSLKRLFYLLVSRQTHMSDCIGSLRVVIVFGPFRIAKVFVTCCLA